MKKKLGLSLLAALATAALGVTTSVQAQQASMTFFVTSVGKGNGADLGGLEGADAHCAALARAAGSTQTNWRAYLSTTEPGGAAGVNARDRIGKGAWQNAKGVVVAKSVEGSPLRFEQYHQADGLDRERRDGQRPRRRGQHARHSDRLRPARPVFYGRWRHHLRELDEERRGFSDRGSP